MINSPDNIELKIEYKKRSALVKRSVRQITRDSWDKYISEIENDIHGRQNCAYKIMKHLNKEERDTLNINPIEEQKWLNYFKELWTSRESKEFILAQPQQNIDPITQEELQNALQTGKNKKAPGTDKINLELLKYASNKTQIKILNFINVCWHSGHVPEEWNTAQISPIFKKGDRSDPRNYRGICILNSCYKLYVKIINNRLRPIMEALIEEFQYGFRKGRSCTDCIFTISQLIEKRKEFNLPTFFAFIDYEKAFDRVDRSILWKILENKGIPSHLIRVIQSLYLNNTIQLKTSRNNKMAEINQGVRQGCPLSPTLFNLYMDEVIRIWLNEISLDFKLNDINCTTILFADDQVVISESENALQQAVFKLDRIASSFNMKISSNKTKAMAFIGSQPVRVKLVIENRIIEQINTFTYLGCSITYGKKCEIQEKLNKFNNFCGTIRRTLGKKVRKETLMKYYKVMAIPSLLYGCESWVLKKNEERRIEASEMKFLRYVAGYTLLDKKRNEDIRKELKIDSIIQLIKEYQHNWKEHVNRMPTTSITRAAMNYNPSGRRSLGRPAKRWRDQF